MAWVVMAAFAVAARAGAQQGVSIGAGLALPIGALGDQAGTGFGIALRDEGPLPWWQLDYRVDVGLEHFPGRAGAASLDYTSIAFNVVQWPSKTLYDFGGVGLYNSRTTRSSDRFGSSGTNIGLQGGVGYVWEGRYLPFVEFGLTNLFTGGQNAPWFSVRVGGHF
jgi:hypothetical protein